MAQTAADRFVEIFVAVGTTRVYRVLGDSRNGLPDALYRQAKIELIHGRNEEVGTSAAGAVAHLTGELAVCADSCGPGNLFPINGLFDCRPSPVPVLGIAAQMSSAEIGAGIVSKTHSQTPVQEYSYYWKLVSVPSQMRRTPEAAIRQAVTKRGVSVVVTPGDVGLQPASDPSATKIGGLLSPRPAVVPAFADIDRLAELLNGKGWVTVLCGLQCQGARAAKRSSFAMPTVRNELRVRIVQKRWAQCHARATARPRRRGSMADERPLMDRYGPVNAATETLSGCFHQSRHKRTGVCS
jgi:pyruvate dehydrogenase (quinone)